jgi:soluble lytic murein transglycosylase-like protein
VRRERIGRMVVVAAIALAAAGEARAQIYTRVNANGVVEATNIPDGPGYRLTYVGKGTLIHSRGFFRGSYTGQFDPHILAAAAVHGVSVDLVKAVIAVESEFDPLAVSSKGARGLMQLMPFTAQRFGVNDSFDPRQNIFGGVQYLRFLLDMFQGDVALALAGYNAGENAVARFKGIPPFRETQSYVQKIQALLGWGPGGGGSAGAGVAAAYYAPAAPLTPLGTPKRPARITPARPRIYYRWNDDGGHLHVAGVPPPEGVSYSMIRALD